MTRPRPARAQRPRGLGQEHAVGRHGEVPDPAAGREHRHELRQVPPDEGLASRQADPVDAQVREDSDEPGDLLEVEDVLPRQPGVVLLRHAVSAAQVAPVGDREAQVPERAPEGVQQRHERSILVA